MVDLLFMQSNLGKLYIKTIKFGLDWINLYFELDIHIQPNIKNTI